MGQLTPPKNICHICTWIEPVPCLTFPNNEPRRTGLSFSVPGITPDSPVIMFKLVVPSGLWRKNPIWEPFGPFRFLSFSAAPRIRGFSGFQKRDWKLIIVCKRIVRDFLKWLVVFGDKIGFKKFYLLLQMLLVRLFPVRSSHRVLLQNDQEDAVQLPWYLQSPMSHNIFKSFLTN